MSVTATFTQNEYTLTVNTVGSGTVSKTPDQPTYHYGDVVQLQANASAGWTFSAWSGDLTGSENPKNITITGNMSVTATFTQNEYTLTVNTVGSGTVAKTPDQPTYHYGDVVQLQANASTGWSFSAWSGDLTGSENPKNITITGNMSVTATFTQNEYTLTVNTVGSGTVAKTPDQPTYHYGDVVQLLANASTGWSFSAWSGDLTGSENPKNITITGNMSVTATFTQNEYTLTVNTVGSGTVAKTPDQPTYHYGDVVQLQANASTGWSFSEWSGDLTGSENPKNITTPGNMSVTATFIQNEYPLIVNTAGPARVAKAPDQPTYHYGDIVQLQANASTGWTFSAWSGDLTGSENPKNITITGNMSVTATFTQIESTLTVNPVGSGTVAKTPDQPTYH